MSAASQTSDTQLLWLGGVDERPLREIPKDVWGPRGWYWLHLQAIEYPDKPTRLDRLGVSARFWAFLATLPCAECRRHAHEYAGEHAPDFSSSWAYQTWAWRFHNAVNKRLGKTIMSASEYRKEYREEIDERYHQHVGV